MLIHLRFTDEMADSLSRRATEAVGGLDLPWRFAPRGDYHPDHNPEGLISFATAENAWDPLVGNKRLGLTLFRLW